MNRPAVVLGAAVPAIVLLGGFLTRFRAPERRSAPPPIRRAAAVAPVEAPEPALREIAILHAPAAPAEGVRGDAPAGTPSELSALVAERRAERAFWEELEVLPEAGESLGRPRCRATALRRTAEYLGLSGRFEPAAAEATSEIARAWERRNARIESVGAALAPDQREIQEREIQESYEADKRAALARFDTVLRPDGRHRRFRSRLEEWIDLVR